MTRRLVPKRRPAPAALDTVPTHEQLTGTVQVSRGLNWLLTAGTVLGLLLGLLVAVPALARWQPGESGQAGLQSLLNRMSAGDSLTAEELWAPEALARLADRSQAPTEPFGGPDAVREALGWTTTFTVESAVKTPAGPQTTWDEGTYPVFEKSTFTLGGVEHAIHTAWTMTARRRDGQWKLSLARAELLSSSLPVTALSGGSAPRTQQEIQAECGMTRALPEQTFDGDAGCLLPGGVTSDLIDPAVRPLLDGGATAAPSNFHAVAGPSELVPSATRGSATPMAVWRFEHDGQTYHAVYVPTADESARLVAVVRA